MKKSVSILGTGWLGMPLAQLLLKEGYVVKGSTTSQDKLAILKDADITPFLIKVAAEGVTGEVKDFLKESQVLIVNFPPGLRGDPQQDYVGAVQKLAGAVNESGVKKVIFISSTSVYEETSEVPTYTADDAPNATSTTGREIAAAEKIMLENPLFDTTLIRFGGLIGTGRHPAKFLAGRTGVANPVAPVNLIHLEDCLQVIKKVLENDIFGRVYNAVYPIHPSRQEYYTQKTTEAGLQPPQFDHSKPSIGKIISSAEIEQELRMPFLAKI